MASCDGLLAEQVSHEAIRHRQMVYGKMCVFSCRYHMRSSGTIKWCMARCVRSASRYHMRPSGTVKWCMARCVCSAEQVSHEAIRHRQMVYGKMCAFSCRYHMRPSGTVKWCMARCVPSASRYHMRPSGTVKWCMARCVRSAAGIT